MGQEIVNRNKDSIFHGDYVGRDNIAVNIVMLQDSEREFVVTHNANIKPVSYFTGRETELHELRQRIEEGRKSVLVSGMGGIGKTHICRKLFEEYLNRHAEDGKCPFRYIGYVEYSGDMGGSLQSCLKFKQQDSPEQNQEAAWRELEYLAADGKLLLFVDNVDRLIGEDSGLQRLKGIPGAIVLTSRQISFGDEFEPYRIGFLGMEQCKEIYEKIRFEGSGKKVRPEEVLDLEYVIENLVGRHTITVELLAHLARTKPWSVKKLREELEEKGFRLTFHKDGELVNIQESYEVLYDLSELTEAEKNILEAFSVFPYLPLAAETCNEWLLADAGVSEDDDILMGLYQKGWLQFDVEQESYALHPVFAQFIYEKCSPEAHNHSILIEKCKLSFAVDDSGCAKKYQHFILFAETMIKKFNIEICEEYGELAEYLSFFLQYMAEYGEAEKWKKVIVDKYEKKYGKNHPYTATSYCNLAAVYEKQGKFAEAETFYKKSLDIRERVLGEEHSNTADSYNNLAGLYKEQGKYTLAAELYEKSIRICEQIYGENHPKTANGYNNLGSLYHRQKKYVEAEALYEKSIRIWIKVQKENHLDAGLVLSNLAGVYMKLEKYEKAEKLYEESIEIYERNYGENNYNTVVLYEDLAIVYSYQKKYERAEELYLKGISIRKRALGQKHQTILNDYNNLAQMYMEQKDFSKAEKLYEKCIRIQEKINGKVHPDTIKYCDNLAKIYVDKGEYEKAEKMFGKCMWIQEKVSGYKHPYMAVRYDHLAYAYQLQKRYVEAEKFYKKGIEILKEADGKNYTNITRIYGNLAALHEQNGEYQQVLLSDLEVYKIWFGEFGSNYQKTQESYNMLKSTYSKCNSEGNFKQWLEEQMKK